MIDGSKSVYDNDFLLEEILFSILGTFIVIVVLVISFVLLVTLGEASWKSDWHYILMGSVISVLLNLVPSVRWRIVWLGMMVFCAVYGIGLAFISKEDD